MPTKQSPLRWVRKCPKCFSQNLTITIVRAFEDLYMPEVIDCMNCGYDGEECLMEQTPYPQYVFMVETEDYYITKLVPVEVQPERKAKC